MKMKLAILAAVLISCTLASAQDEQALKGALLNHTVVVRGYFVAPELKFDQTGKLLSPAAGGFGQLDARIYIDKVSLPQDKLIIEGQRTFSQYNPKTQQFLVGLTGEKATVEIALPPGKPAVTSALELLKEVFFTTPELQNQSSAEEQARFHEALHRVIDPQKSPSKPSDVASSAAQSLAELPRTCLPTGEEAYQARNGVRPPKALKTPDPA
jgi:hypothetical protein